MRKTIWVACVVGFGCVIFGGSALSAEPGGNRYAWVELGPGSRLKARLIVESPDRDCPKIEVEFRGGAKKAVPMALRSGASENFPVRVCEAELASTVSRASVEGHPLPVLPPKPLSKIAVLGDTGCRIKGKQIQSCNDPESWPLAQIASSIAKWKPDLVIHVGDYHYRESSCPAGAVACQGATSGDRWQSWQEDFFAPTASLFGSSPWIFVRGNHESCSRAGKGWSRFLDPHAFSDACSDHADPYPLSVGDHRFWVMDSAEEKTVASSLAEMRSAPPADLGWIFTHRPMRRDAEHAKDFPRGTRLILAGHLHRFSVDVLDRLPPELITGNGGALLEPGLSDSSSYHQFGFLTLERKSKESWEILERDRKGVPVIRCDFRENPKGGTALECRKAGS